MNEENLIWEDYEEALQNIFGREKLNNAVRIVNGEDYLINTALHKDFHNMLEMYNRLELKKQNGLFTL